MRLGLSYYPGLNMYVLVGSPRMSRKRKARTKKRQSSTSDRSPNQNSDSTENNEELAYLDTLPEVCLTLSNKGKGDCLYI